jgi:hypothetical protein
MFQYVIDLRRLLTLDQRLATGWQQQCLMQDIKNAIVNYMRQFEDPYTMDFQFDYVYMKTVGDEWLVLSKLAGHPWYRAIIETNVITPE